MFENKVKKVHARPIRERENIIQSGMQRPLYGGGIILII
jgi:hypothetical protein